jgi:hypothetical protein
MAEEHLPLGDIRYYYYLPVINKGGFSGPYEYFSMFWYVESTVTFVADLKLYLLHWVVGANKKKGRLNG